MQLSYFFLLLLGKCTPEWKLVFIWGSNILRKCLEKGTFRDLSKTQEVTLGKRREYPRFQENSKKLNKGLLTGKKRLEDTGSH